MSYETPAIVQKIWNFCDVLRDDGVSYGDYVEQLTYLLFLKMADEMTMLPFKQKITIPSRYSWPTLTSKSGDELEAHYREVLEHLSHKPGLLGMIFRKSQNKIQDPAKLDRLIKLIDGEPKDSNKIIWMGLDIDVKGEIYEGLLEKNAEDVKGGAGQYFTPRALITAIVDVIRPSPMETIGDPACGTGGFFLAAHKFLIENFNLDPDQKKFLKQHTFKGCDIVTEVARLCAMNMYLHNIGSTKNQILATDSLIADTKDRFDIIMTNPPFGKKAGTTIVSNAGKVERQIVSYERNDFWATTANKQLNFIQHVKTLLKSNGRCAIVIPDNVLFEGGAGETIRRMMLEQMDVHTLLRLPTGIFYAGGVKANVLFFDKKPARPDGRPWTEKLWIYDFRTNQHFTLKQNPITRSHLDDFVRCYNSKNRQERKETKHFKMFTYDSLLKREKVNLDIQWLSDKSANKLGSTLLPKAIAGEISDNLQSALDAVNNLISEFKNEQDT